MTLRIPNLQLFLIKIPGNASKIAFVFFLWNFLANPTAQEKNNCTTVFLVKFYVGIASSLFLNRQHFPLIVDKKKVFQAPGVDKTR